MNTPLEPENLTDNNPGVWFYVSVISISILVICGVALGLNYFGVISFSNKTSSDFTVSETSKGSLTSKNREPAKQALNAVGEVNSVASVGANYLQFTNAIQSSKIKFDAAMREYAPTTKEEEEIAIELASVLLSYVEAKDIWSEFIEDGDEYGFLPMKQGITTNRLASKYGYKAEKSEYFKDTVLGTVLRKAERDFQQITSRINK